MKTKVLSISLVFICCLLEFTPLSAQLNSSFKASIIYHGVVKSDQYERYSLDRNTVIPGVSFNLGFIHSYPILKEKNIQLNFGLLYEYASYSRLKIDRFETGGLFKRKEKFQSQYILFPLELEYHYGKFSLAVGANLALNFYTKLTFKSCGSTNDNCRAATRHFSEYKINQPDGFYSRADLPDGAYNLILTAGLYYHWKPRLKIGLIYRDFNYDNTYLHTNIDNNGVENIYYNYQTNSISFTLLYRLNESNK